MRVAINGFGRIGRLVFRAICTRDVAIDVVAINDLTDTKTLAHLLAHDSVHGHLAGVSYDAQHLIINGKYIQIYAEKDPHALPWKDLNVDVVVESTGLFTNKEKAHYHIEAGAKKVLISAPAKDSIDFTVVKGVNEHLYDKQNHHIVSNASCTTNCLAPIVKVLQDNFGIEQGFMTTVHAYTADQRLVDAPHSDLRRARNAATNIVPTSTGAAKAVSEVIPELKGKLDGIALRVPVPDGSVTDFVCQLKKETSKEEINALMKSVSRNELKGIIDYLDYPAVSSDIVGNPHSSIFDPEYTFVQGKTVKVLAWYDNEWGYSNRMVDVILLL